MSKLILGLAGEIGSGKGVITKHIVENYNAESHRFSQIFRDVLDRLYLDQSRENMTAISVALRKTFGEDIVAKVMYHDAREDKSDIVIIDGIRRLEDMKHLREIPYFKFLYIESDIQTRYDRITQRAENANEMRKSFAEFEASHEYETEKTIPPLKKYADYVIENNGTYPELYQKIDEIIKQYI